jgi:hypothetical protein
MVEDDVEQGICMNCGELIPANGPSCPKCGVSFTDCEICFRKAVNISAFTSASGSKCPACGKNYQWFECLECKSAVNIDKMRCDKCGTLIYIDGEIKIIPKGSMIQIQEKVSLSEVLLNRIYEINESSKAEAKKLKEVLEAKITVSPNKVKSGESTNIRLSLKNTGSEPVDLFFVTHANQKINISVMNAETNEIIDPPTSPKPIYCERPGPPYRVGLTLMPGAEVYHELDWEAVRRGYGPAPVDPKQVDSVIPPKPLRGEEVVRTMGPLPPGRYKIHVHAQFYYDLHGIEKPFGEFEVVGPPLPEGLDEPEPKTVSSSDLPTKRVKVLSAINYEQAIIIYKVKVENNSKSAITDVCITPYVPRDIFLVDEEDRTIPLIKKGEAKTSTFTIRPRFECGNVEIRGDVRYYDTLADEHSIIKIKPREVQVQCPLLIAKPINEEQWQDLISSLVSVKEITNEIPFNADELFDLVSNAIRDMKMYMLKPELENDRFVGKFYSEGIKGFKYAIQLEILGGYQNSKLILNAFAENEECLMGFYHKLLDEIEDRTNLKEYIRDPIKLTCILPVGYNKNPNQKIDNREWK